MPTIRELLELTPKEVSHDVHTLFGYTYNHVPEINYDEHGYEWRDITSPRVEMVTFYRNTWDHRRYQVLGGVKLDGQWVMITQNAGREGDDFKRRYILDADLYWELVKHIKELLIDHNKPAKHVNVTSLDQDIPDLYNFYGEDVSVPYMRW